MPQSNPYPGWVFHVQKDGTWNMGRPGAFPGRQVPWEQASQEMRSAIIKNARNAPEGFTEQEVPRGTARGRRFQVEFDFPFFGPHRS